MPSFEIKAARSSPFDTNVAVSPSNRAPVPPQLVEEHTGVVFRGVLPDRCSATTHAWAFAWSSSCNARRSVFARTSTASAAQGASVRHSRSGPFFVASTPVSAWPCARAHPSRALAVLALAPRTRPFHNVHAAKRRPGPTRDPAVGPPQTPEDARARTAADGPFKRRGGPSARSARAQGRRRRAPRRSPSIPTWRRAPPGTGTCAARANASPPRGARHATTAAAAPAAPAASASSALRRASRVTKSKAVAAVLGDAQRDDATPTARSASSYNISCAKPSSSMAARAVSRWRMSRRRARRPRPPSGRGRRRAPPGCRASLQKPRPRRPPSLLSAPTPLCRGSS